MREKLLSILAMLCLTITSAWSADGDTFQAETTEGITMTFKIISESEKTCQVGDGGFYSQSILKTYAGPVGIPASPNGYSVVAIGDYAFAQCTAITSFDIPETVRSIGYRGLYHCSSITSINLPSGLLTIDEAGLEGCSNLRTANLPNGLTSLGKRAFWQCSSLESIVIPSGVKEIENEAFLSCLKLKKAVISEGVEKIGNLAFSNCDSLQEIKIPKSVKEIHESAFDLVGRKLISVIVDAGNTVYDSRDNCNAIIHTASNQLVRGCSTTIIPSSVTSIGTRAFCRCVDLTGITLPAGLTTIGNGAFYYCINLAGITIPNGVKSIGEEAFIYCYALKEITIPSNVETIGKSLFWGCSSLEKVTINSPIADLKSYTFNSCKKLKTVLLPSSIIKFEDYVFVGCTDLSSINLPTGLLEIGENAFSGCSGLGSISLPASLKKIGEYAFNGCSSLSSINIPENITKIEAHLFHGCSNLESATLHNAIDSIGDYAFAMCPKLSGITIPNQTEYIGTGAFYGCKGLSSITFPVGLLEIGPSAFYDCLFSDVVIPASVTSIGSTAFLGNTYNTITFKGDMPEGQGAFYNIGTATIPAKLIVPETYYNTYKADVDKHGGPKDNTFFADCYFSISTETSPVTYTTTFADGTEDDQKWTINPNPAAEGNTISLIYNGTMKVKSIAIFTKDTDSDISSEVNLKFEPTTHPFRWSFTMPAYDVKAKVVYYTLDELAVAAVIDLIKAIIPLEYTDACKGRIKKAFIAYNNLTDTQKSLLVQTLLQMLMNDESSISQAAKAIILIQVVGQVEYDDITKALVDAVNTAYQSLTDAQKAKVKVYYDELMAQIAAYLKAAVEYLINNIGEVTYSDACKAKIDAARSAYNKLPDAVKTSISNYSTLTDAEAAYEALKQAAEVVSGEIDLATVTSNITVADGSTLYGSLGVEVKISIADGAKVSLNNASINAENAWTTKRFAGITCLGDATISLSGDNIVIVIWKLSRYLGASKQDTDHPRRW